MSQIFLYSILIVFPYTEDESMIKNIITAYNFYFPLRIFPLNCAIFYILECGLWSKGSERSPRGLEKSSSSSNEWPSLAILLHTESSNKYPDQDPRTNACTASVLTPTWVITAYSCLKSK